MPYGGNRGTGMRGLVLFMLVFVLALPGLRAEGPFLESACEIDYPPFCFADATGKASGFSVELMTAVLEKMDRRVRYRVETWPVVRGWLERGEVDCLPLVGRTPEREKFFDFTVPYLTLHGALIVREGTRDVHGLADLEGREVSVLAGDNAEEFLRREERGLRIRTVSSFLVALKELAGGQSDAVLIPRLVALRLMGEAKIEGLRILPEAVAGFEQRFCFAVPNGRSELLALLNEGLAVAMADGTHRHLHARWFAALEMPKRRAILVGGDRSFPPFEFLDEQGKPGGYNVDLVRAVARELGLRVEFRLDRWDRVRESLVERRIDMVQGMYFSPERNLTVEFGPAHATCSSVLVWRKKEGRPAGGLEGLAGRRVAAERADVMHELIEARGIRAELLLVDDQRAVLHALRDGRADVGLATRRTALWWIEREGLTELEVGWDPIMSLDYCFAAPKGSRALIAQFGEGLKLLERSGELQALREKWFGVLDHEHGWRYHFRSSLRFLLPLGVLLLLVFAWGWTLRRQVAKRTAELRESTALQRALFECSPIALYACDPDGRVILWNESSERIFGWTSEEAIGEFLPIVPPDRLEEFAALRRRIMEEGAFDGVELQRKRKGGELFPMRLSAAAIRDGEGRIVGIMGAVVDLTEDRRREAERASLQEQLLQAQKMESVGRLAGGVAHDFNNMLSVILGYAEMGLLDCDESSVFRPYFKEIQGAAQRSAEVTRQLLGFARKQAIRPVRLDVNEKVRNTLNLLGRLIGEEIELIWRPSTSLWAVRVDAVQLDQILTNLCVNARDAIAGQGKILIETANMTFGEDELVSRQSLLPGDYVVLSVSDDGCGMDEATREKIFEPFFTTKEIGEGSGLGLATVYGIMRQNDGFVHVYSEPGQGSTFRLYFPRFVSEAEDVPAPEAEAVEDDVGVTATVLVVEDEASNLELVRRILERHGCRVKVAERPSRALEILKGDEAVDLLLCDVVMPEFDGRELAERARVLRPEIRVIYMSGYSEAMLNERGVLEAGVRLLEKPIAVAPLVEAVRTALEEEERREPARGA